jgi:hypothetical protein
LAISGNLGKTGWHSETEGERKEKGRGDHSAWIILQTTELAFYDETIVKQSRRLGGTSSHDMKHMMQNNLR